MPDHPQSDLFDTDLRASGSANENATHAGAFDAILPGVDVCRAMAAPAQLQGVINDVLADSPLRHMQTSRGQTMSVAMSNCGSVGWVSDRRGYRYSPDDPLTGKPWPAMPQVLQALATNAAARCGYAHFHPDACLINQYLPGARMGAHQDRDECDFSQPIVSVSLGLPARFFMVGPERKGRSTPIDLESGDVVVFGGPARLFFHGVRPLKPGSDRVFGGQRINLTFRCTS